MNLASPNGRDLSTFWTTRIYGYKFVPPASFELDIDICFVLWDDKEQRPRWINTASPRFQWVIPAWWFGDVDPRSVSPAAVEDALLAALETIPFMPTPQTGVMHMLSPEEMAKIPPGEREKYAKQSKDDFFRSINRAPREYETPRDPARGTVDAGGYVQVDGDVDKDSLTDAPPSS